MNKLKLYFFITISALLILSILLYSDKKQIGRQSDEITELENKVEDLKGKISSLESEKEELEDKVTRLTEFGNSLQQTELRNRLQYITPQDLSNGSILGKDYATVVFKKSSCDYFILENNSGYIVAEWIGGNEPDQGDIISGNFNSFGTKDFYNQSRKSNCRLWIDDYLLSKDGALEKISEHCD